VLTWKVEQLLLNVEKTKEKRETGKTVEVLASTILVYIEMVMERS